MPDRHRRFTRPEAGQLLLVRFSGDLTTKADATRRQMTRRLLDNLRASIKESGRAARVDLSRNRIYVALEPASPGAPNDLAMVERLGRVFGVQSVSLSHATPWRALADVVREGEAFGLPFVTGRTFAIRARRLGERHEVALRSADVQEQLGRALLAASAGVDLDDVLEAVARREVERRRAETEPHAREPTPNGDRAGSRSSSPPCPSP